MRAKEAPEKYRGERCIDIISGDFLRSKTRGKNSLIMARVVNKNAYCIIHSHIYFFCGPGLGRVSMLYYTLVAKTTEDLAQSTVL